LLFYIFTVFQVLNKNNPSFGFEAFLKNQMLIRKLGFFEKKRKSG